ncbi:MAG TPA: c-type cytochrome [Bryobacteraceae bacterium]|nr:c-type cytochrome [Bryobacteraceae bacterium]
MLRSFATAISAAAILMTQGLHAQTNRPPGPVRTSGDSIGPYDKQIVDDAAAARGRTLFAAECVDCHGPLARGSEKGANLIRSEVVLKDRVGSELGPFLKKGHPLQSNKNSADLTSDQVADISHFLKQRINDALKRSPTGINKVTGNVAAGKAYFNGDGKCASCHAITEGSPHTLFAISARYPDSVNLQQAMLFPGGGRGGRGFSAGPSAGGVTITVTAPGEPAVTGTPVQLDDFDVQLRDSDGKVYKWSRTPALKIVKHDPLAAHHELLDRLTNDNVHDLVVYLETLK